MSLGEIEKAQGRMMLLARVSGQGVRARATAVATAVARPRLIARRPLSTVAEAKGRVEDLLRDNQGVLVFSKSTCPYCREAKSVLSAGDVTPQVVELNEDPQGAEMQRALLGITGQRTVPNIFVGAEHVGGYTELVNGLKDGRVTKMLDDAGVFHLFDDGKE